MLDPVHPKMFRVHRIVNPVHLMIDPDHPNQYLDHLMLNPVHPKQHPDHFIMLPDLFILFKQQKDKPPQPFILFKQQRIRGKETRKAMAKQKIRLKQIFISTALHSVLVAMLKKRIPRHILSISTRGIPKRNSLFWLAS